MRRRALLASLAPLVAGCGTRIGDDGTSPTTSGSTPDAASPAATSRPLPQIPRPDGDCTVTGRPDPAHGYPDLPGTPDPGGVTWFASEFETELAGGRLDAREGTEFAGTDGGTTRLERQTARGFLVFVRVALRHVATDATPTATRTTESTAWYYVTRSFAARAPGGSGSVPETGWTIVACRDG